MKKLGRRGPLIEHTQKYWDAASGCDRGAEGIAPTPPLLSSRTFQSDFPTGTTRIIWFSYLYLVLVYMYSRI